MKYDYYSESGLVKIANSYHFRPFSIIFRHLKIDFAQRVRYNAWCPPKLCNWVTSIQIYRGRCGMSSKKFMQIRIYVDKPVCNIWKVYQVWSPWHITNRIVHDWSLIAWKLYLEECLYVCVVDNISPTYMINGHQHLQPNTVVTWYMVIAVSVE